MVARSRKDGEQRMTANGYEVSFRDDEKFWIHIVMTVVQHDEYTKTTEPHTLKG